MIEYNNKYFNYIYEFYYIIKYYTFFIKILNIY